MNYFNRVILLCRLIATAILSAAAVTGCYNESLSSEAGTVRLSIKLDSGNRIAVKGTDILPQGYIPEKEVLDFDPHSPSAIEFEDPEVKRRCVVLWDTDGDGELSYAEASAVTDIYPFRQTKNSVEDTTVTSFEELRYFTGLSRIPRFTFNRYTKLRKIRLPYCLSEILYEGLGYCKSLEEISIPDSLTKVDSYSFYQSTGLKYIRFPRNLTSIETNAFDYISQNDMVLPYSVKTIGDTFQFNSNLERAVLPMGIEKIGSVCFAGCYNLRKLIIRAVIPPKLDYYNSLFPLSGRNVEIFVPVSSIEAYKEAKGWHRFNTRYRPMIYQDEDEMAVNSFRIYVFDGDKLVESQYIEGDSGILEVPKGSEYQIYVIANMETDPGIVSKDGFSTLRVSFGENRSGNFIMTSDPLSIEADGDKQVKVTLKRLVSKISIEGDVGFYRDGHRYPHECRLLGAFVINIPEHADYYGTADTSTWINRTEIASPYSENAAPLTYVAAPESEYMGRSVFYCMPNPEPEGDDTETDSVTKLIVAAEMDGAVRYWSIGIPNIRSNTIYSIGNIRIHSPGTSGQNDYVPTTKASIDLAETDWSTGMTRGTSLEINL